MRKRDWIGGFICVIWSIWWLGYYGDRWDAVAACGIFAMSGMFVGEWSGRVLERDRCLRMLDKVVEEKKEELIQSINEKRSEDQDDGGHLEWIHSRLVEVHGEDRGMSYMIRLRAIIKKLKK